MRYFVLADIHGCYEPLMRALDKWNPETERLVQLGDMVDRGPDSASVLRHLMDQKEKQGAIILKGNHEQMFLDYLDNPSEDYFYLNGGGRATVDSFFGEETAYQKTSEYIADYIKEEHADIVQFIRELPVFHEKDGWVFVHAGVNLAYENWRSSNEKDFLWIRDAFHYTYNPHPERFVFGHTPTRRLHPKGSDDIWVSSCQTKIGLDGACVFGGQLNVLQINGENYQTFSVKG